MNTNVVPLRDREERWPPPCSFEAEMALLGAILCDNKSYGWVSSFLQPQHFLDPDHRQIFEAMGDLIDEGKAVDPITLKNYFPENAWPEKGGVGYLARLMASVVTVINAPDYGRTIYDMWQRRCIMDVATELDESARQVQTDEIAQDIIARGEAQLSQLTGDGGYSTGTRALKDVSETAAEMADAAHKQDRAVIGLSSGYRRMDAKIAGLRPGQLIIIGGRPGLGKSDLGWNVVQRVAGAGHKAMVFSLEMSAEELSFRAIAQRSGVPASVVMAGRMEGDQPEKVFAAAEEIKALPIVVNDEPALAVSQMRSIARRHNPELIMVDYLQLIPAAEQGERYNGDVQRVTAVSQALKAMAKSLKVPVIALCQLNRAVEQRDDKRPQLSDLRESGAIEQDADVVAFIYREEYYIARNRPKESAPADRWAAWKADLEAARGKAEIQIAKQRMGPTGRIDLTYSGARSAFEEPDQPEPEQEFGF